MKIPNLDRVKDPPLFPNDDIKDSFATNLNLGSVKDLSFFPNYDIKDARPTKGVL